MATPVSGSQRVPGEEGVEGRGQGRLPVGGRAGLGRLQLCAEGRTMGMEEGQQ